MQVFLVRHAIALPPGSPGIQSDADRPLTLPGRERFRRAVQGLGALGVELSGIVTSPWVRARETAELLGSLQGEPAPPRTSDLLCTPPGAATLGLFADGVALVGHEPWLSELLALACFGGPGAAPGIRFAKGAVARLEGTPTPGGMWLRALWPARSLARAMKRLPPP